MYDMKFPTLNDAEIERRRRTAEALESRGLTLNTLPAYICGFQNRFAMVRQTNGPIEGQWAWPTLHSMVEGGSRTLSM
jgi:hypothetical protein